ncbi:hypothetical protein CBM2609_A140344 [Cupriavidus taiwanensis]|nr:hypothetical protein CBM2588_A180250 [Cupriavidus taiwanensis]SOY50876.1 hypothetical protein CBM2592_A230096 [Cupriavidus taiwanensis]SOY83754.1 hypothetical protein CBM2591_A270106 [Cupriavidus taiwanensis]SOZ14254.1 hypothetical protein CBM2604_A120342 [Cupriavidus taiwanensis]SOZ25619.1 hypothetical protein CBM2609_A140344 [Cupriavidus taiwanensis]
MRATSTSSSPPFPPTRRSGRWKKVAARWLGRRRHEDHLSRDDARGERQLPGGHRPRHRRAGRHPHRAQWPRPPCYQNFLSRLLRAALADGNSLAFDRHVRLPPIAGSPARLNVRAILRPSPTLQRARPGGTFTACFSPSR